MRRKRLKFLPQPALTPEQQSYRDRLMLLRVDLDTAERAVEPAKEKLKRATRNCPHVIYRVGWMPTTKSDPEDSDCDSASCAVCGSDLGWWCPKSPDHTCHYFSIGSMRGSCYGSEHLEDTPFTYGMVYLRSGEGFGRFVRPPEHDMERESRDRCLWCGEPDERK